jgi:hypothetical protein
MEPEAGETLGQGFSCPGDEKTGKKKINLQYPVSLVNSKLHIVLVLLRHKNKKAWIDK